MKPIRISIEEDEFSALAAGQVVDFKNVRGRTVEISLADIGFPRLIELIVEAKFRAKKKAENEQF